MHLGITKTFWKKVDVGIEEIILGLIIILNIFDGFEWISSDWDYIKKIISWSALGILFYRADINKIFTGSTNKRVNLLLIFGFFSLILKNLVSYAIVAQNGASTFLRPLYDFLIQNSTTIEIMSIYVGVTLILFASIYFAILQKIRSPSVLYFLHSNYNQPKTAKEFIWRTLSFFIVSLIFFVAVFNLVMEWLAISIDAPLVIIGLSVYFFFVLKHQKKFKTNSFLANFGDFGNKIYTNILNHLKYRHKFILVLGGILSLHLVTDLLIFIWPYIFGVKDALYFTLLGPNHAPIWDLLVINILGQTILIKLILFTLYLLNVVGLVFLLTLPAYIWILLFREKELKFSKNTMNLFKIQNLKSTYLSGIDIQTHIISIENIYVKILFLLIFILITLIMTDRFKKNSNHLVVVSSQIFFLTYIIKYVISITYNYFTMFNNLIFAQKYFILLFFIILLICTMIFYIAGIFGFEYNLVNWIKLKREVHFKHKK